MVCNKGELRIIKIPFTELPNIAAHRFHHDNSSLAVGLACIAYLSGPDYTTIIVDPTFRIVGWSRNIDANLMTRREGQTGIMFWTDAEDIGYVWAHFSIDETDFSKITIIVAHDIIV